MGPRRQLGKIRRLVVKVGSGMVTTTDAAASIERHLPAPSDTAPVYFMRASDRLWAWLYLPIARVVEVIARVVGLLQQGRIGVYLGYSFVTLIALLFFVR